MRALYPARLVDAERRAQDLPDDQRQRTIEQLRRAHALIGSTDNRERMFPALDHREPRRQARIASVSQARRGLSDRRY